MVKVKVNINGGSSARVKDEHLRRMRQPDSYPFFSWVVAMIGGGNWVLGSKMMAYDPRESEQK